MCCLLGDYYNDEEIKKKEEERLNLDEYTKKEWESLSDEERQDAISKL